MNYNFRIESNTGFKMVCGDTADMLKLACGKIPQNGKRYPESMPNTVILQSNNPYDLIDAMIKGYWDHSNRPAQAKVGDRLFIVVSNPVAKELGSNIALEGVVSTEAYKVDKIDKSWSSSVLNSVDLLLDKAIEVEAAQ